MMALNKWVVCGAALAAAVSIGRPAAAEVISAGQNGFEIRETVHVAAAPHTTHLFNAIMISLPSHPHIV